jgi:hypothetical protein
MGVAFILNTGPTLALNLRSEAPKQYVYFLMSNTGAAPPSGKVHKVAAHTTDALASALAASVAGDTIQFPDIGVYPLPASFVFPENRTYIGRGIYAQNGGGAGTWLQGTGTISLGSGITFGIANNSAAGLLIGKNGSGLATSFRPVPKGSSAAGSDTNANGSHDCTFNFVRFKGGGDAGGNAGSLLVNFDSGGSGWDTSHNRLRVCHVINHVYNDCELERPQALNSVLVTTTFKNGNPGEIVNWWPDLRSGGAQVYGNHFNRCHFGVRNGYHTGVDGYGMGTTFLIQSGPDGIYATSLTGTIPLGCGPNLQGGSQITYQVTPTLKTQWNPTFDWGQVNHNARDISLTDCLAEYANWTPFDICDISRAYSMWHGIYYWIHTQGHGGLDCLDGNPAAGYGNPSAATTQYVNFPDSVFVRNFSMTRCYVKGSLMTNYQQENQGEVTRGSVFTDCYHGTYPQFWNQNGVCGSTVTGSFSNANRPVTALFPAGAGHDWNGITTSYTPSPYDPA